VWLILSWKGGVVYLIASGGGGAAAREGNYIVDHGESEEGVTCAPLSLVFGRYRRKSLGSKG